MRFLAATTPSSAARNRIMAFAVASCLLTNGALVAATENPQPGTPLPEPPFVELNPPAITNPYRNATPVNIDLEQFNEDNLWIYVGLNGGAPHRYLFDTGSWGFYAIYAPEWWPGQPASLFKTAGTDTELYGDMTFGYEFVPVRSSIKLYNYYNRLGAYTFPESDYAIAKVLTEYDVYKPKEKIFQENADVAQSRLDAQNGISDSLDDHGVFGAGFCLQWKGSAALGYANLSNLLAEAPGGGYIVTDNGPLGRATLTLGLNRALRSQFSQFLTLHPDYSSGGFPDTHWPSYEPATVQVTLSRAGHAPVVYSGSFWLDTGSGESSVSIPSDVCPDASAYLRADGSLVPGTKIHVTDPTRKDGLDYTRDVYLDDASTHPFKGKLVQRGKDEVGIWFGIDFFRHESVMYDLKNGVMGFSAHRPGLDPTVLNRPDVGGSEVTKSP